MKKSQKPSSKPQQSKNRKKKTLNIVNDDKFRIVDVTNNTRSISKADIDRVIDDRANRVAAYISTILEPELAVTEGHMAKQPTMFPIPSTTVSFRNNVNISTDQNGDFALAWNPNFFANVDALERYTITSNSEPNAVADTLSHLITKDPVNAGRLLAIPSYVPDVALSKYRLVSAKLKVTYIGSVLNKSGMMYACATYDQTPVCVGSRPQGTAQMQFLDTTGRFINWTLDEWKGTILGRAFSNMNEQAISNGIWNKSLNVTNTNQGMSCLHIPTDPMNEIFYPIGTYFGNSIQTSYNVYGGTPLGKAIPISFSCDSGAQLCYLMCGHGLPAGTECINIQVYYNYEVIPTQTTAPFLRPAMDTLSKAERELVRGVVYDVAPNVATSSKVGARNIWSSLKNMIRNVDWSNVAQSALRLVPQVLKMF